MFPLYYTNEEYSHTFLFYPHHPFVLFLFAVLFLLLNVWSCHIYIWCVIFLNKMDFNLWNCVLVYFSSSSTLICVLCNKASNLLNVWHQGLIQAVFDNGIMILGKLIWAWPNVILSKTETSIKPNSNFFMKSATCEWNNEKIKNKCNV